MTNQNGNGWVKDHRKVLGWEWFRCPQTAHFFRYCVLKANHKEGRFMGHSVPAGSFITSLGNAAFETGLTIQNIRTAIKNLKSTNELTSQSTNKFTILSITNYEKYQEDNRPTNNQLTNDQQSTNNQLTTNNNDNNNKNDKKEVSGVSVSPPAPPPSPDWDGGNEDKISAKAIVKISDDFELPDEFVDHGRSMGWQDPEIVKHCQEFKFYWTQGKGAGKRRNVKGWRQAWANWLSKAGKWGR